MEQGTMIGTILGFTLLLIAMCFDFSTFQVNIGNLAYFIDIPSLLIVVGGTVASAIYLMMQGVQILRIHDVNELLQGIKVFKETIKN